MHIYIHNNIYTYIWKYIHINIYIYIYIYIYTYTYKYIYIYIHGLRNLYTHTHAHEPWGFWSELQFRYRGKDWPLQCLVCCWHLLQKISIYISIYIHMNTCNIYILYTYEHISTNIYTCICKYIYECMYIHI